MIGPRALHSIHSTRQLVSHGGSFCEGAAMDLGGWVRRLGLELHEAAFRENKIDNTVVPRLTAIRPCGLDE
jgi:hypothetical protein